MSAPTVRAAASQQSQLLLAGAEGGTRGGKVSSFRKTTSRPVPASTAKVIKPVIQISIPYNATALVLDTSRKISRIFVGTDEGDVIAYDFTGNVEESFTYIATLVKRASWKVDSGVTSFCLTNGGRSQGVNYRNAPADAAGDGKAYTIGVGLSSGGYVILDTTHIMEKMVFNSVDATYSEGVEEPESRGGIGDDYDDGIMVDDPEVLFNEIRRNAEDRSKPTAMGTSSSGIVKLGDPALLERRSITEKGNQAMRKYMEKNASSNRQKLAQ